MSRTAGDAIAKDAVTVDIYRHPPQGIVSNKTFLVFDCSDIRPVFRGVVSSTDAAKFPHRIFADLLPRSPSSTINVNASTPIRQLESCFTQHRQQHVYVNDENGEFIGVITHSSFLDALIDEQQTEIKNFAYDPLSQSQEDSNLLSIDTLKKLQFNLTKIASVIAHQNFELFFLQEFINDLRDLVHVKYAVINLTLPAFCQSESFYSGLTNQQAKYIADIPKLLGVFDSTATSQQLIRIDDLNEHLNSALLPKNLLKIKTLLLVPLFNEHTFFGHVLISERLDGALFDQENELLAQSSCQFISLMLANLIEKKSHLNTKKELGKITNSDDLTGLPKIAQIQYDYGKIFAQDKENEIQLSLLVIHIDDFDNLNEALGYEGNSVLLPLIAARLIDYDQENSIVTRTGRDEFLIVIKGVRNPVKLANTTLMYMSLFTAPFTINRESHYLSVSAGISIYPDDAESFDELFDCARTALHSAKRKGKQQKAFYSKDMDKATRRRLFVENRLKKAIHENKLDLNYQFQINSIDRSICGVEALLRWHDEMLGDVSPSEFIPIAEESELMIEIGSWVMSAACSQRKLWLNQGIDSFPMAVNVSASQIIKGDLEEVVSSVVNKTGLPATLLELEITENCALEFPETLIDTLRRLKASGITLSVDDFGTGYSNLNYLAQMPIDQIKIDRSFIKNIDVDKGTTIPYAIIDLAKGLGLSVIAEGVETKEQLEKLLAHDCTRFQGYYFHKPLSAEKCDPVLEEYIKR